MMEKPTQKKAKKQKETLAKELTFKDLKGMPTFKSKRKNQNSFTTNNQKLLFTVKIPKGQFFLRTNRKKLSFSYLFFCIITIGVLVTAFIL